ncbi:MAG TPA: hypothetical protein VGE88_03755 [Lysobacter sp.]
MKTFIPLSIAAVLLAACQAASAQSAMGVIRFEGAIMESTGGHSPVSGVAATNDAPHRSSEQTLGVPATTRAELLDYFVATRREVGIDTRDLRLFTRTYL